MKSSPIMAKITALFLANVEPTEELYVNNIQFTLSVYDRE
jgi:hypothetical protein